MSMIGNFLMVSEDDYNQLINNPDQIEDFLYDREHSDDMFLDIDSLWNIIHFLLTGEESYDEDNPTLKDKVVLAGTPIGNIDVGYGPAQGSDREEVKSIAQFLNNTTIEELSKNFVKEKLDHVELYRGGWECSTEEFEYIKEGYLKLVDFYNKAVEKGYCVIKYIN